MDVVVCLFVILALEVPASGTQNSSGPTAFSAFSFFVFFSLLHMPDPLVTDLDCGISHFSRFPLRSLPRSLHLGSNLAAARQTLSSSGKKKKKIYLSLLVPPSFFYFFLIFFSFFKLWCLEIAEFEKKTDKAYE